MLRQAAHPALANGGKCLENLSFDLLPANREVG